MFAWNQPHCNNILYANSLLAMVATASRIKEVWGRNFPTHFKIPTAKLVLKRIVMDFHMYRKIV